MKTTKNPKSIKVQAKSAQASLPIQRKQVYCNCSTCKLTRSTIKFFESSKEETRLNGIWLDHTKSNTRMQICKFPPNTATQVASRISLFKKSSNVKASIKTNLLRLKKNVSHRLAMRFSARSMYLQRIKREDGSVMYVQTTYRRLTSPFTLNTGRSKLITESIAFTSLFWIAVCLIFSL